MLDIAAPISFSVGVFTLIAVVFSILKNPQLSLSLLFSLVMARYVTEQGVPEMHGHVLFIGALISISTFKGFSYSLLDIDKNEVNYCFAFLDVVRMAVVLIMIFGFIGSEAMWIISMLFLILQILLVIGNSINGYSSKLNGGINSYRIGFHNTIAAYIRGES